MDGRTTALMGAAAALLALGTACDDTEGGKGTNVRQEANLVISDLEREAAPEVSATDQAALGAGNRAFAFALYSALAQEPGNLFFSPHSISAALVMAYAGARGRTAEEMADVLHFTLPPATLHAAFNHLDQELARRAEADPPASFPDARPPLLHIANSIWGQRDYAFEAAFLDTLAVDYGAGLRVLDLAGDPGGSRETINRWISDQTKARIPELIPEGAITPQMRLVLTNAIYFLANWHKPFTPEATRSGTFHAEGTNEVAVDMMHQTDYFDYATADGYASVSLPYVGGQIAMILVVPDAGRFAEIEARLGPDLFDSIVAALGNRNVTLAMPRWEFESTFSLGRTLAQIGMPRAFDLDTADFSGMTRTERLCISEVIHQAFISVDEEGTEAAAATAVMLMGTALPPEPVVLTIDRPFLFLIVDEPSGTVLFAGRVTDPR